MIKIALTKFGAEEEASGIAALGFDVKAFLIQLVTFLLVLYILKRFVFSRIVELQEKRRKTIESGLKLTAEMIAEKEKLEQEITRVLKEARKDADKILASGQEQAENMIREAEHAAQAKADGMLEDAKKKIVDETQRARRALERETVDLVIRATETIAREKLDPKKDARLITQALKGNS